MADAIVLLGIRDEDAHLSLRMSDFGWKAEIASDVDQLRRVYSHTSVLAVYFDPRSLEMPWQRALGHVMRAAPTALPIVCLHFSDHSSIDVITAQGAFYVLRVPFAAHEVQQSLGFLHSAVTRKRSSIHLVAQKAATKAS